MCHQALTLSSSHAINGILSLFSLYTLARIDQDFS
jgi:hypothetical protein